MCVKIKMEVRISGGEMSSLFYELANGREDVEGFLLGKVVRTMVNTVSDSHSENVEELQIATVQGFVPCGRAFSFYDGVGQINDQKLSCILQDKHENVIGWYKFRRNTQMLVSLRERAIHHNLVKHLKLPQAKSFIFVLATTAMSQGMSAYGVDYCMQCSCSRASSFESLQANVINLGDTSHSEYRVDFHTASTTSDVYHKVINGFRDELVDDNGVMRQSKYVDSMYVLMMKKLKEVATEVQQSEAYVSILSEEVASRRMELQRAREELAQTTETCKDSSKRNGAEVCLLDAEVPEQKIPVLQSLKTKQQTPNSKGNETTEPIMSNRESRRTSIEKKMSPASLLNDKPQSSQRRKQARPGRVMSFSNDEEDDSDEMPDYTIKSDCLNSQIHPIDSCSPTY